MGDERTIAGKTCLVTGATAGIGLTTARGLARMGARVLIVGSRAERGSAAVEEISRDTAGAQVEFLKADLSDQAQVRQLAQAVHDRCDRLDVLVNNAGGLFSPRQLSADGIEMTFALNHLAYFLLTHLLLDRLAAAGRARIVNVASGAHKRVTLDLDDLQGERDYRGWRAYGRSKLANILFTYELARRLTGRTVTANALHPGFVASELGWRHRFMPALAWRLLTLRALSPEEGAETSIHLAASPEVEGMSGAYFKKCRPVRSSAASYDDDAARRLWAISCALTGLQDVAGAPATVPGPGAT